MWAARKDPEAAEAPAPGPVAASLPPEAGQEVGLRRIGPLDRDSAARRVLQFVAEAFAVTVPDLLKTGRCIAAIALARQVAMYLMHVELGRPFTEVGRLMGRDRTTVTHACALVEERREDGRFDARIDAIEAKIRDDANGWEAGDVRFNAR